MVRSRRSVVVQRERYRLPSPMGSDRYNAGHEFWPRDGYAAAGLPSRPVLEQLQHQHEQGQARLQVVIHTVWC